MPATTKYHRLPFLDQLSVLEADGYQANFPAHRHEEFSITLVRSGFEITKIHGKELQAPVGTISITPPEEIHANPNGNQSPYDFTTFYLSPDVVRKIKPFGELLPSGVTLQNPHLFQGLQEWLKSSQDPKVFTGLLYGLFERIPRPSGKTIELTGGEVRRMTAVTTYVEHHLEDAIKLSDLAKVAGWSDAHFLRVFKKQRGLTPLQFVTLRRIEQAKTYLRQDVPPAMTALRVGFYDQSHFHRYFLRHTGLTPGQFQRSSNIVQSSRDLPA